MLICITENLQSSKCGNIPAGSALNFLDKEALELLNSEAATVVRNIQLKEKAIALMQKFGLQLVTGPVVERVSLILAKNHLRQDDAYDDALISFLLTAACEYVEHYMNHAIFGQTWKLTLDQFPYHSSRNTITPAARDNWLSFGGYIESMQIQLPVAKASSVTSITYADASGNAQTLDPSSYNLATNILVDCSTKEGLLGSLGRSLVA